MGKMGHKHAKQIECPNVATATATAVADGEVKWGEVKTFSSHSPFAIDCSCRPSRTESNWSVEDIDNQERWKSSWKSVESFHAKTIKNEKRLLLRRFSNDFERHFNAQLFSRLKHNSHRSLSSVCNEITTYHSNTAGCQGVYKRGWLWKQGKLTRKWKKRWFVAQDGSSGYQVHYRKKEHVGEGAKDSLGEFSPFGYVVRKFTSKEAAEHGNHGFVLMPFNNVSHSKRRSWYFRGESEKEILGWMAFFVWASHKAEEKWKNENTLRLAFVATVQTLRLTEHHHWTLWRPWDENPSVLIESLIHGILEKVLKEEQDIHSKRFRHGLHGQCARLWIQCQSKALATYHHATEEAAQLSKKYLDIEQYMHTHLKDHLDGVLNSMRECIDNLNAPAFRAFYLALLECYELVASYCIHLKGKEWCSEAAKASQQCRILEFRQPLRSIYERLQKVCIVELINFVIIADPIKNYENEMVYIVLEEFRLLVNHKLSALFREEDIDDMWTESECQNVMTRVVVRLLVDPLLSTVFKKHFETIQESICMVEDHFQADFSLEFGYGDIARECLAQECEDVLRRHMKVYIFYQNNQHDFK